MIISVPSIDIAMAFVMERGHANRHSHHNRYSRYSP